MGPTEQAVRGAASPGEALIILAQAIDRQTNSPDVDWALPPPQGDPEGVVTVPYLERPSSELKGDLSNKVAEGGVTVDLPPTTDRQREFRQGYAAQAVANLPNIPPEQALDWYMKGGPLWLIAYDYEHVLSLSSNTRKMMVEDVAITMPEEAKRTGADLLKERDDEAQKSWAADVVGLDD
jgi:hypothetical protein